MFDHGNHDHNSQYAATAELDLSRPPKRKGFLAPHSSWSPNILATLPPPGESIVNMAAGTDSGLGRFETRPPWVSEKRWTSMLSAFQTNIGRLDGLIETFGPDRGKFRSPPPKHDARGYRIHPEDPIENWVKAKLAEVIGQIKARRVIEGAKSEIAGDAFDIKSKYLESEEGQLWFNTQVYAIMVYANARGMARAGGVDVNLMVDDFARCITNIDQLHEIAGDLHNKYK